MKRVVSAVMGLGMLCMVATSFGADEKKPAESKYAGNKMCIGCHKKMDDSVSKWEASKHAKAYEALASDAAKKINPNAQKDPKCLKCHVTGLDKEGGYSLKADAKNDAVTGVTCESCHGAGKNYMAPMMKKPVDAAALKAAGLVTPDVKTCQSCHNEESPTFDKEKKLEEMLKEIKHGAKIETK